MPRKGHSRHLERGIAVDGSGFRVRVSVGSGRHRRTAERRFPPTVDLPFLRAQRAQLEADLREDLQQAADVAPVRGTFASDVRQYLTRMKGRLDPATYRSRASELAAWVRAFGARPRHAIRPADVERAIASWNVPDERPAVRTETGRLVKPRPWTKPSPKTLQNRVRALRHLFTTLGGARTRTPADDVRVAPAPRVRPREVDRRAIRTVVARLIRQERRGRLRDAKTRARFLVLVTTGQRPVQLRRTSAADVDVERRIWWVPPAKGGDSVPLWLNDDMLRAWQLSVAAGAWGAFDVRSFARALRRAGWPAGVRVYAARHSVGIALSERGTDLADIQAFLGHRRIQTTRDFYVPMLFSRLKAASQALDGRVSMGPRAARYAGTVKSARAVGDRVNDTGSGG